MGTWHKHLETEAKRKKFRRKATQRFRKMKKELRHKGLLIHFELQVWKNGDWAKEQTFTGQPEAVTVTIQRQQNGVQCRLIDTDWRNSKRHHQTVVHPLPTGGNNG